MKFISLLVIALAFYGCSETPQTPKNLDFYDFNGESISFRGKVVVVEVLFANTNEPGTHLEASTFDILEVAQSGFDETMQVFVLERVSDKMRCLLPIKESADDISVDFQGLRNPVIIGKDEMLHQLITHLHVKTLSDLSVLAFYGKEPRIFRKKEINEKISAAPSLAINDVNDALHFMNDLIDYQKKDNEVFLKMREQANGIHIDPPRTNGQLLISKLCVQKGLNPAKSRIEMAKIFKNFDDDELSATLQIAKNLAKAYPETESHEHAH